MTINWNDVGRNIRQRRRDRFMTQKDLADAAGVSASSLSQIESGTQKAGLETLIRIAQALKVELKTITEANERRMFDQIFSRNEPPAVWKEAAMQAVSQALDAKKTVAILFGQVKQRPRRTTSGRQHSLVLYPFDPQALGRGEAAHVTMAHSVADQIIENDRLLIVATTISQWDGRRKQHLSFFQALFVAVTESNPAADRLAQLLDRVADYLAD